MPLRRDFRLHRRQVVKPGQDFFPGTVGTTGVPHGPHPHCGHIFMSQGTAPPDPPFAGGRDLGRQQRAIFCRMPLLSYPWKLRGHIIFSRQDHSPSADWTSSPVQGAGLNRNTPLVPFFALPPNFAFGAEGDLLGRQCAIFRRVPFLGQSGKLTGQIIDAWSHSTVGTHRAAAAICAGMDGCTPHMAMAAPPPYLFLTSRQAHTPATAADFWWGAILLPIPGTDWPNRFLPATQLCRSSMGNQCGWRCGCSPLPSSAGLFYTATRPFSCCQRGCFQG